MNRKQSQRECRRQKSMADTSRFPVELDSQDLLDIIVQAEKAYLSHLRAHGIDTDQFPVINAYIPEIGITRPTVCLPNAMKPAFGAWLHGEFFPSLGLQRRKRS
jgi:hypothetical protein